MFATSIFPAGAVTAFTSEITSQITDNMPVILAVVAFMTGIGIVLALMNAAFYGRMSAKINRSLGKPYHYTDDINFDSHYRGDEF